MRYVPFSVKVSHTLMEEKHIPLIWRIWLLHIEIFGIYKTCSFENLGVFLGDDELKWTQKVGHNLMVHNEQEI